MSRGNFDDDCDFTSSSNSESIRIPDLQQELDHQSPHQNQIVFFGLCSFLSISSILYQMSIFRISFKQPFYDFC